MHMRFPPIFLAAYCAFAASAGAAPAAAPSTVPARWQPVDARQLDAARGGFSLPSGLAVGLGIERTVAINGELVTQTRFAIADVRALTAEQAIQARTAMTSLQLIQNGRVASPDTLPGAVPGPVAGAAAA